MVKYIKTNIIHGAVHDGSTECVKFLIDYLNENETALDENNLSHLLKSAIEDNQPCMVDCILDEIEKSEKSALLLQTISMSTLAVERADISILRSLKKCGVTFSTAANGIIEQKERKPVGFLLQTGIMLYKFTDFLREKLSKNAGISYNIKKFNHLKEQLSEQIKPPTPQDPISKTENAASSKGYYQK